MCLIIGIMSKNISIRESHAIVIRNLGRLTFSRKNLANVLKLDVPKQGIQAGNFNTSAITLKRHASKHELYGENPEELSASKSTGKYA